MVDSTFLDFFTSLVASSVYNIELQSLSCIINVFKVAYSTIVLVKFERVFKKITFIT